MKIFLLPWLIFFSLISHANGPDFTKITGSDDGSETKIKMSSVSYGKNKKGDAFTSAVFQTYIPSNDKLFITERYVLDKDCERGYGRVFTLDTDGKFIFSSDFALEGETNSSNIAKSLCIAYENRKKRIEKQAQSASADAKWRQTIDEFFKTQASLPNGIDYRKDEFKLMQFDAIVKQIASDPKNNDKTMLWFLVEADRIVKEHYSPERSLKSP